jgi:DNA-binding response OmpR family regulator
MPAPCLNILVVEDEALIAMMVEDFVDLLGHSVCGTCDSVAGAVARIEEGGIDVAILDVNLRDGPSWPVADALAEKNIPFVFASGGHVDAPGHVGAPLLSKPFTLDGVRVALERITA